MQHKLVLTVVQHPENNAWGWQRLTMLITTPLAECGRT